MFLSYEQAYSKLVYSKFQHYQGLFNISTNSSFTIQIENINFHISDFEFNAFHRLERKINEFLPVRVDVCENFMEKKMNFL